ncbi:thiamine phosphate synthase [Pelagibacterales bacterium SAG-MED01]|mgnify:FL=1|nr:thiamine phosphate synthase [Pelagibacterales bacterium SAG-MED01]
MHNKKLNIFTFISEFKKEKILKLNKNIGIIFRNHNRSVEKEKLLDLKNFCKTQGRKLFLANNFRLAVNLDLDGVYLSSYNKELGYKKYNIKKKFLILGSAHNFKEINLKKKQGVKLIFLSPLFKTKDYKKRLGITKFNILSRYAKNEIIALGGINEKNIKKLKMIKAYGFSAISYFN